MTQPPWDDERLDLDWREWRHIFLGSLVVVAFVVLVSVVAGGT
jgi:hypothetical protein